MSRGRGVVGETYESHQVKVLPLLLVCEGVGVDDLAVEEVNEVACCVGFFGVVVGEEAQVGEGPAEDVVDQEDGDFFVGADDVGCGREKEKSVLW